LAGDPGTGIRRRGETTDLARGWGGQGCKEQALRGPDNPPGQGGNVGEWFFVELQKNTPMGGRRGGLIALPVVEPQTSPIGAAAAAFRPIAGELQRSKREEERKYKDGRKNVHWNRGTCGGPHHCLRTKHSGAPKRQRGSPRRFLPAGGRGPGGGKWEVVRAGPGRLLIGTDGKGRWGLSVSHPNY